MILSARVARARGCRAIVGNQVAASDDDAGLGAAEQLVAREGDDGGAGVDGLADAGLVPQPLRPVRQPGRRLVEQTRAGVDHHRRPEPGESRHRGGLGEPDHPVVRRVHLEDQRDVGAQRAFVVGEARAVGGADLDQPTARLGHDLRHAEAAADLDQLAPRHHDVPAACERGERQQHRRGVVVHDQPRLGPARAREQRAGVSVPRPAPAGRQIELQVRIRAADACGVGQRVGGDRRAPEVGVQQHAGRVHDGAEPGALQPLDPARRVTDDGFLVDVAAGRDRHPSVRDRVPRGIGEQRVGEAGEPAHDPVDRGKGTPGVHRPTYNMKVKVCARSPYGREWD